MKLRRLLVNMVLIIAVVLCMGAIVGPLSGWEFSDIRFLGGSPIEFEGATDDTYETTLALTDPTADNTITMPDDTGNICYIAEAGKSALSGAGAIPLTDAVCEWTTTGTNAGTLANGENGQILVVVIVTDGGEGTLTPSTSTGWATAVFTSDIDTASFLYVDDTVGWVVLGTSSDGTNLVALTQ